MQIGIIWHPAVILDLRWITKFSPTSVMVTAWWWFYNPIHNMWRLSINWNMFGVDKVGTIPCGFWASTTAHWYHLAPSSDPRFQTNYQIWSAGCVAVTAYDGGSISSSRACEGCHSSCKWLEWKYEPFHVALELRPMQQIGSIWHLAVIHVFSSIFQVWYHRCW